MNKNQWLNLVSGLIKAVVFILACYFIYEVVQKNATALNSIEISINGFFIAFIFLLITIYAVLMMVLVFAWLTLLGFKQPIVCARVYFKSQILKYLPGNIFHFAYRHQQTKKYDFTHKQLGMAAAYESITLVITALLVANFLFLWPNQITWLTSWLPIPYWPVLLIEIIGLIFAFQLIKNSGLLTVLFCYLIYFAGMGWISYLLAFAFGFESQPYLFMTACFAASWLAGYVIPGAPGGTGVREVVFILLSTPIMAELEALIIIALIRLISIIAETSLYFMAPRLSQVYRHFATLSDKTMP